MKTPVKEILDVLRNKFGTVNKIRNESSLYYIPAVDTVVYCGYSKVAEREMPHASYRLRKKSLALMAKKAENRFLFLLTDQPDRNAFVPLKRYEPCFADTEPGVDGGYKLTHYFNTDGTGKAIYFANIGKFNSEAYFDLDSVLYGEGIRYMRTDGHGVRLPAWAIGSGCEGGDFAPKEVQ